jgi:hypothetical protein
LKKVIPSGLEGKSAWEGKAYRKLFHKRSGRKKRLRCSTSQAVVKEKALVMFYITGGRQGKSACEQMDAYVSHAGAPQTKFSSPSRRRAARQNFLNRLPRQPCPSPPPSPCRPEGRAILEPSGAPPSPSGAAPSPSGVPPCPSGRPPSLSGGAPSPSGVPSCPSGGPPSPSRVPPPPRPVQPWLYLFLLAFS